MPYSYEYPHAAITADCCVFGYDGNEMQILLIQRREEPHKGQWALPGGFLRMDETIEECALRELQGETGLKPDFLEQFQVFSAVDRDPRERVVTVAFLALVPTIDVRGGDDAARARWFPIDSVPHLAFDHQVILEAARNALRDRMRMHPQSFGLLVDKFTSKQLQYLYQTILGDSVDSGGLIRSMLLQRMVHDTGETASSATHPKLYSFAANSLAGLKGDGHLH